MRMRGTVVSMSSATVLLAAVAASAEECVTIVADLAGPAAVADSASARPKDRWPVQLLQCLPPRKVVALEDGARTTLFFPAQGTSFDLAGPGRYEVTAEGVRPLSGAAAPKPRVLNDAFKDVALDRSRLVPAGVRMRNPSAADRVVLLEPRDVVTESAALLFRWEAAAGSAGPYRFRLAREGGASAFEAVVDATELALPAEVALAPGERFVWHVEDLSSPGRAAARWQSFVVATEAARALARRLDAQLAAPSTAERNLRDLLLMQRMMMTGS
jgi:hypothetical protein